MEHSLSLIQGLEAQYSNTWYLYNTPLHTLSIRGHPIYIARSFRPRSHPNRPPCAGVANGRVSQMTFPPPHPSAQNSIASSTTKSSGVRPLTRTQQSAWGLPGSVAGAGRGLTPLSTDLSSDSASRPRNTLSASPFLPSFSSVVNSSPGASHSRNNFSALSSSNTPFPPLQTGSQQASSNQQISSPRIKNITPSSQSGLVSSAAAPSTAIQGGGGGIGGGGGGSRNQTFSPSLTQPSLSSPTSNTFERATFTGSGSSSAVSGSTSVSKIVVTQVFLLLGSITEKEGKGKWESQAEAIHKVSCA